MPFNADYAINAIVSQYLTTAAWADGEEFHQSSWSVKALADAREHVVTFLNLVGGVNGDMLEGLHYDDIGHDLWLSRNSHGTGFWDRDHRYGDKLHEIAVSMGSCTLYVDENDEINFDI